MKYIITFGTNHLKDFNIDAAKTALIVEGNDEYEARNQVFNFNGIGDKFCTSYDYSQILKFKDRGFEEITLEDLEKLRFSKK